MATAGVVAFPPSLQVMYHFSFFFPTASISDSIFHHLVCLCVHVVSVCPLSNRSTRIERTGVLIRTKFGVSTWNQ